MFKQDGQGLAEYALILAIIAIVAIIVLIFLGESLSGVIEQIAPSPSPTFKSGA